MAGINQVFGMAAMPFLCNGILLFQFNLPRVLSVLILKYCYKVMQVFIVTGLFAGQHNTLLFNFPSIKLRPDKYNNMLVFLSPILICSYLCAGNGLA